VGHSIRLITRDFIKGKFEALTKVAMCEAARLTGNDKDVKDG
jgi:hypothetical protein